MAGISLQAPRTPHLSVCAAVACAASHAVKPATFNSFRSLSVDNRVIIQHIKIMCSQLAAIVMLNHYNRISIMKNKMYITKVAGSFNSNGIRRARG